MTQNKKPMLQRIAGVLIGIKNLATVLTLASIFIYGFVALYSYHRALFKVLIVWIAADGLLMLVYWLIKRRQKHAKTAGPQP